MIDGVLPEALPGPPGAVLDTVTICGRPPMVQAPLDVQLPVYKLALYGADIYKVTKFRRSYGLPVDHSKDEKYDAKLSQSFSRARRVVLELGLSNPWEYFFTGTLDKSKYDRFDLSKFHKDLTQWIRDLRKKYGADIAFLFVPEHHEDGAWHIHGLISGLPKKCLSAFVPGVHPDKLVRRGYLNWAEYSVKFGFCSLAPVKDPLRVAFYMVKYISKDLDARHDELGAHLYYHSRGLKRPSDFCEVYYDSDLLDSLLSNQYKFCSTGYARPSDDDFGYWVDEAKWGDDPGVVRLDKLVPADLSELFFPDRETNKLDRMSEAVIAYQQIDMGVVI